MVHPTSLDVKRNVKSPHPLSNLQTKVHHVLLCKSRVEIIDDGYMGVKKDLK